MCLWAPLGLSFPPKMAVVATSPSWILKHGVFQYLRISTMALLIIVKNFDLMFATNPKTFLTKIQDSWAAMINFTGIIRPWRPFDTRSPNFVHFDLLLWNYKYVNFFAGLQAWKCLFAVFWSSFRLTTQTGNYVNEIPETLSAVQAIAVLAVY